MTTVDIEKTTKENKKHTISGNGFTIEVNTQEKSTILHTGGYHNEPVIGFVDEKGWRYAGISKTTGNRLWVADKDLGIMSWNTAVTFIQELKSFQGFDGSKQYKANQLEDSSLDDGGVRLPTRAELNQIYENKADLGKFDSSDQWYWSSSQEYNKNKAYDQHFQGGGQRLDIKSSESSVRFVRSELRPKP